MDLTKFFSKEAIAKLLPIVKEQLAGVNIAEVYAKLGKRNTLILGGAASVIVLTLASLFLK